MSMAAGGRRSVGAALAPSAAAPPLAPTERRPPQTSGRSLLLVLVAVAASPLALPAADAQDPFADAVASFTPGTGAGFGAEDLPDIVLGPPRGGGEIQQSLDVVSLGNNGVITLRFDLPVICDGPGPDLTISENPFHVGTPDGLVFEEDGIVAVSQDGEHFVEFPYDPVTHAGLAGRAPVLSTPDNRISPLDPSVSGGDQFDLADVGLAWAAYVRVTDPGDSIADPGNLIPPGDKGGFDLDAMAALRACDPSGAATPTPTASGATTPTPTATATPIPQPGDLDGNGVVDAADLRWLIAELYDGDGDDAAAAIGGSIASGPAADVNGDGTITAADLAAMLDVPAIPFGLLAHSSP